MSVLESSFWAWTAEAGLGFVGFGAGLLFVREAQRGGTLPGCGPTSGCEAVAGSRWARVGPVPVAALGLGLYGLLTLAAGARLVASLDALAHTLQVVAVTAAGGAALWFTALQLFVIRRVCKFCMIFHGIGLVLCIVVWRENQPPAGGEMIVGSGCVLAMVLWQILVPSKTYAVIPMADLSPGGNGATRAITPGSTPIDGEMDLLGGRLRLTPADWPILGSHEAKHKVALMFDITCDDCRALFRLLQQAVANRPGDIAVVLVPVPLDPACNPAIAKAAAEKDTCAHARLFLAIWQTDRSAFAEYSVWLMSAVRCPPFQDAKSKMHRQLGTPLSMALTAGALDLRIQKAVGLYRQSTAQKLPQLLLANRLVVGRVSSFKDLWGTLDGAS